MLRLPVTSILIVKLYYYFISSGSAAQRGLWRPRFTRFRDHTQRRATVGRTTLGRVISSSHRPLPDNTQPKNTHAPCGIRTHDRSRRAAVDLRLSPRGYWDRYL
jgi:hypothetical protein